MEIWSLSILPFCHTKTVRYQLWMKIIIFRCLSFRPSIFWRLNDISYLIFEPCLNQPLGPKWLVNPLRLCMDSHSISQHSVFRIWGSTMFGIKIFIYPNFSTPQGILNYNVIFIFFSAKLNMRGRKDLAYLSWSKTWGGILNISCSKVHAVLYCC